MRFFYLIYSLIVVVSSLVFSYSGRDSASGSWRSSSTHTRSGWAFGHK